ncbi:MAG: hypothetical protein HYS15_01810, partial [Candidatus Spechtbacteria bacterium]|nr:hypothetical protein [Candidatus Spechtbacteria bacterium]
IYHLKRNEFITLKSIGDKKFELALTPKGQELFGQYNFYTLKIPAQKRWDKKWRIIAFDIPEKYRTSRDTFRERLKSMGFFQFQKSFWIYPFDCEREIHYLCEHLGLHDYVFVFKGKFVKDRLLTKYFQRKKVLKKEHLRIK